MEEHRYQYLMETDNEPLSPTEIAAGWHFCAFGWDGLLIGPPMKEFEFCECGVKEAYEYESSSRTWRAEAMTQVKAKRNRAKCRLCGSIIESLHRHDFKKCSCGEIMVDGGNDYWRCGAKDWRNFIRLDDDGNPMEKHNEL